VEKLFLRMRRLALILLVALLALPAAALAARSDKGFGSFELRSASGVFVVTGNGVLLGQLDKGTVRVQSLTAADAADPAVSGLGLHSHELSDLSATVFSGTNIHFRVTTGKYKITFRGTGLDLTAVGVGTADMIASPLVDAGQYTLDGSKWIDVPLKWTSVPYGAKSSAASATGP
jgi:hypothetical protein